MQIADSSYRIMTDIVGRKEEMYNLIEEVGRTCYQSKVKDIEGHGARFVDAIVKRKHLGLLEHALMTVEFIIDRGATHELVRHRHASFAQESTRYCNYSKGKFGNEITVINIDGGMDIDPVMAKLTNDEKFKIWLEWKEACVHAQNSYMRMLKLGASPQMARGVLPTSLASNIKVTANLREWRHIFALRALELTGPVHPQMLEVMKPLYEECLAALPEVFSGIGEADIE